jgi:K+-sensing histidine kinase KdpD
MHKDNNYKSIPLRQVSSREKHKDISFLLEIGSLLATSRNLKSYLDKALQKVLEFFDLEAGRIYLLDDTGEYLDLIAHRGMIPAGLERQHINEGFSGLAVKNSAFIAQHVTQLADKRRAKLLLNRGFKTIICTPLISMTKVEGVMNLATGKEVSLNDEKVDVFTFVGNQIATAMNNLKLYLELENKVEKLKEKNDTIQFFTNTITHDLKSPATSIYGIAKLFEDKYMEYLDDKGREYCGQILRTAKHIVDLVDKINSFVNGIEVSYKFEKIELNEITAIVKNQFSDELNRRQIKWIEPDSRRELVADRLSLIRVFQNFTENALKYGGNEMSTIEIEHEESESHHILSFSDDGVGIAKNSNEDLFAPFYRHSTSNGHSGSGLGLAIVNKVVEGHKGQFWMHSNETRGLTFFVSIIKDLEISEE